MYELPFNVNSAFITRSCKWIQEKKKSNLKIVACFVINKLNSFDYSII